MPATVKGRPRQISVNRNPTRPPTLAQMIREGQESAARIKRATKEALLEWFAQSERLNIARTHYKLRGERFIDFAGRLGVDRASAYQLVKLLRHRDTILRRCADEGRYYGWETCLYWFEKSPRRLWPRERDEAYKSDEYSTPSEVFRKFGASCTLDVCATPGKAMCAEHFTKGEDGLKQRWVGTAWMNPPFSDIHRWCAKAYEYAKSGGTVVALLPAWTDAPWFHEFVAFGRITFSSRQVVLCRPSGLCPVSQHDCGVELEDGEAAPW